jgi:hypothetical protein
MQRYFVNKNEDEIQPFYPNANRNNNQHRMCRINNGQGRNNLVVADFGNRLYLRRIMGKIVRPYQELTQLDDILSVPLTAVSELY